MELRVDFGSMVSLKQKTVQFYLRAIGGLVVFLALLIFLFHKEPIGFPLVPVGGYVGTISGLVEPTKVERTFYVERIPDSSSIVFVAFADRFEPQVVTSTRLEVKEANLIDPVTINFKERSFRLLGYGEDGEFEGGVFVGAERVGEWNLRSLKAGELSIGADKLNASEPGISDWLAIQAQYRDLSAKIKQAKKRYEENRDKFYKLQKFVGDKALLQERAQELRVRLKDELKQAEETQSKESTTLDALVSELDLLARIKKRGKAVELARKVAGRENKWYLANWQAEEGLAGMEESVGEMNIDISKLDAAVKRASEIRKIQGEIESEKKRIQELQELILRGPAEATDPNPNSDPGTGPEKKENKSIWNKIFGLITIPSAEAESTAPRPATLAMGFVDQMLVVPFPPTSTSLLYEMGLGVVRRYAGANVEINATTANDQAVHRLIVGSKVELPQEDAPKEQRFFSFLVFGENATFAASPVTGWTLEKIRKNSHPLSSLQQTVELLDRELRVKNAELQTLNDDLRKVRLAASDIAGVDDIIDLKMKLAGFQGMGEDSMAEAERLKSLIESGRELPEPPEIDYQRQELFEQLAQAAQVTSMADRLQSRRKETAKARLQDQLALIKETQSANPEALARVALELRLRRKNLERQLQVAPQAGDNEF